MADILTPEHKAMIDKALDTITALEAEITKALAAGIDVQKQKDDLAKYKLQLANIKKVYFPVSRR